MWPCLRREGMGLLRCLWGVRRGWGVDGEQSWEGGGRGWGGRLGSRAGGWRGGMRIGSMGEEGEGILGVGGVPGGRIIVVVVVVVRR